MPILDFRKMNKAKRDVIVTHMPEDDQWPYCRKMSEDTGREFHVESMSTGDGSSRLRCLFCYVVFPLLLFFRREQYGVIVAHQQFYGLLLAFYCRLFHVSKTFRLVILTFIYLPKQGLIGKLYHRFIQYVVQSPYIDAYTVHSSSEPQRYASQLGVDASRFHFVPLGMNSFSPQPSVPDMQRRKYILAVGRSNRDYNFLTQALGGTEYEVEIICDSYHNSKVPANIHIHNDIFSEMPLWLHNCYCVVIPLRDPEVSSGQLVLLQAQQMGKPVIVTRSNALKDYISEGVTGLTIQNEPRQLLDALHQLYHDPKLYQQLADNASSNFQQRHSAERQVENTARVIRHIC